MKFGLYGFHRGASEDPVALTRHARLAEEGGFESVWVGDHVALPTRAPGSDGPRVETVATLAFLAAATSTVRLGAGVIVLPQRQPVLLAQQLSTVDKLSRGRLIVGVGVGYVRSELAAFGVSLDERGRRTDEYLAVMQQLWTGAPSSFSGEFTQFNDIVQRPTPYGSRRPPLVIGGRAPGALRRAARVGDGWFGWDLDRSTTAELLDELAAECDRIGRAEPLHITVAPSEPITDELIEAYEELDVGRLVIAPSSTGASLIDGSLTDAFIESTIDVIAPHCR